MTFERSKPVSPDGATGRPDQRSSADVRRRSRDTGVAGVATELPKGMRNVKRVSAGVDATSSVPPCARAISDAM